MLENSLPHGGVFVGEREKKVERFSLDVPLYNLGREYGITIGPEVMEYFHMRSSSRGFKVSHPQSTFLFSKDHAGPRGGVLTIPYKPIGRIFNLTNDTPRKVVPLIQ